MNRGTLTSGVLSDCRNSIQEVAKSYGLQTIDGYKLISYFKEKLENVLLNS